MQYKMDLGARLVPRQSFVKLFRIVSQGTSPWCCTQHLIPGPLLHFAILLPTLQNRNTHKVLKLARTNCRDVMDGKTGATQAGSAAASDPSSAAATAAGTLTTTNSAAGPLPMQMSPAPQSS